MMKMAFAILLLFFATAGAQAQVGSARMDSNISNKAKYDTRRDQLLSQIESLSQGVGRANCCNGRNQFYDQNSGVCRNALNGAALGLCSGTNTRAVTPGSADATNKAAIGNTLDYQAQTRQLLQMKQAVTVLGILKNNVNCCARTQTFFRAPSTCVDPLSNAVSAPACLRSN